MAILSGGFGTRSADPNTPKLLQPLAPNVLLVDQLRATLNSLHSEYSLHFILGHLAEQTQGEILSRFPEANLITREPKGTSDALKFALPQMYSAPTLVIPGDVLLRADLSQLMRDFMSSNLEVMLAVRATDHPEDSDVVTLDSDQSVKQIYLKGNERSEDQVLWGATGLMAMSASAIEKISPMGDLMEAIALEWKRQQLTLGAFVSSEFFLDTGTPERLKKAQDALAEGVVERRGGSLRAAIFIDRDGTLIPDSGSGRKRVSSDELGKSALTMVGRANKLGIPVFLVTNQPGLAKGELLESDVQRTFADLQAIAAESQALFDDFRYCPHHPNQGFMGEIRELKLACECRKPGSGMLRDLAKHHRIDLSKSFMIGDSWRDKGAAINAGCAFIPSDNLNVGRALEKAIAEILRT